MKKRCLIMEHTNLFFFFFFFLACTSLVVANYTPYGKAINLTSIKSLTLHKGSLTTYRRSTPIPQLNCLSGCDHQPDVVQCKNVRSDGRDVLWQCEANLPSNARFAETEVICEGYSSAEDEQVLDGSCGLEYSLAHSGWQGHRSKQQNSYRKRRLVEDQSWGMRRLAAFAVTVYMLYSLYRVCTNRGRR